MRAFALRADPAACRLPIGNGAGAGRPGIRPKKDNDMSKITVTIERPEHLTPLLRDVLATVAKMHNASRACIASALTGACGHVHTGGRHVAACTADGASGERIAIITGTGPDWS